MNLEERMDRCPQRQDAHNSPAEDGVKYKGIRMRKWGKWVSEVRIPKSRAKIWLGSYNTPHQAARAYDAAVFCLRGPRAHFNFPNSIPDIPSASSLSRHQIQRAAAQHALAQIPSTANWNDTKSVFTEEVASPSRLTPFTELEASNDSQVQSWESFWGDSDGNSILDLEKFPSFDMAATDIFFDPPDSWNL